MARRVFSIRVLIDQTERTKPLQKTITTFTNVWSPGLNERQGFILPDDCEEGRREFNFVQFDKINTIGTKR